MARKEDTRDREGKNKGKHKRQQKLATHAYKLKKIQPITNNQEVAFHSFFQGKNLMLHGIAGTGKSYISLYFALNEIVTGNAKRIMIVRSMVPTRDIGFMPGTYEEKMSVYENPYRDMVNDLLCRGDGYDNFKKKGLIEFISTSFVRGITLDDCIIILDEIQNYSDHEINSLLTRVGQNSRILVCGDFRQDDLQMNKRKNGETGIDLLFKIVDRMNSFDCIEFEIEDIVRSGFVKEYIIARTIIENYDGDT
jgi:predicted ribonuclease YlaK